MEALNEKSNHNPAIYEETLLLDEAARFLYMSPATLRIKAVSGEIPAAKPGKRWVFLKSELVSYLRGGYPVTGKAPLSDKQLEDSKCHYKNAATRGGYASQSPTENEYSALLGLKTSDKPKNTTIG